MGFFHNQTSEGLVIIQASNGTEANEILRKLFPGMSGCCFPSYRGKKLPNPKNAEKYSIHYKSGVVIRHGQ